MKMACCYFLTIDDVDLPVVSWLQRSTYVPSVQMKLITWAYIDMGELHGFVPFCDIETYIRGVCGLVEMGLIPR